MSVAIFTSVRHAPPETHSAVPRATSTSAHPALRGLAQWSEAIGQPLLAVELPSGRLVARTHDDQLCHIPAGALRAAQVGSQPQVHSGPKGLTVFTVPLVRGETSAVCGLGYMLSRPGVVPPDLVAAACAQGWSQLKLQQWFADQRHCDAATLSHLLELAGQWVRQQSQESTIRNELNSMVAELEYTYEEISLLHTLTQNMQVSREARELAELSLERLAGVIHSEGHVIWVDKNAEGQGPLFLVEGQVPFDEWQLARLMARLDGHDWARPLVKNHIAETPLGADFPGLRNLVVAPIAEGNERFGWLASCNLSQGQEFGTVQASLLASVASILGTHGRNLELYREHEELLLCFVRSLVSSLDAKDPYTRGHSERVALIARRIGAELKLSDEDLGDIHLSGLLHDIGKIGVDDHILRKPAPLTEEEFEQVKKHPMIGYNILAELKNLRDVIPGVRHHHESWSGDGYPDRLAGEQIPLMARIMAVADSYDAMGSDRPYRPGIPLEKLEQILRRGAGVQWDPRVIDAYFNARDDIRRICREYQTGCAILPEIQAPALSQTLPTTPEGLRATLSALAQSP